ncbi:MAG TPA: lysylphosphatidylglycerol synthase transmembrane domain-containing protein, partial [Candidatus Wallbacteria bacterium]|nr:lysylphosphatidylglycerol synthase transmembrane domain-containing protein [Candidatus Wallbacteria bacterium]
MQMQNQKSIVKKIIIGSLLGAAVFIIIAFMADYKKVAAALMDFPLKLWPFILFLSLMNYAFRLIKWDFYLEKLDIKIPRLSSALIFFSGFIMAITPGKMGEVLKSLLMYEHHGVAVTRSAPAVFMERLTDVLALLFICASGVAFALAGKSHAAGTAPGAGAG